MSILSTDEWAGASQTATSPEIAKAVSLAIPNTVVQGPMESEESLEESANHTGGCLFFPSMSRIDGHARLNADTGPKKATIGNLASFLRLSGIAEIVWDEFLQVEVVPWPEVTVLDEVAVTRLIEECENWGFEEIQPARFKRALHAVAKEETFDSAWHWLHQLPAWDGVKRVERFLPDYCGTASTPYELAVGRYIWTAMAARMMEPGCKVDMVPVLVGKQGTLKSSLLTAIAPTPGHRGDVRLTDRQSDLARKVLGRTVVVWEELRGIRGRVDADEVKTFITSPYVEVPSRSTNGVEHHPRYFVIFGTANRRDFLRDPTGERRYLPFEIGQILLDRVAADKEQLWAEGLHMARRRRDQGLPLVDYEDAERLAVAEHQRYRDQARWVDDEVLSNWLKRTTSPFRTDDALKAVGLEWEGRGPHRSDMIKSLRQLGLEYKSTYVPGMPGRPKRWHQMATAGSQPGAPTP